jgi:uncharacterized protein YegL
MKNLTEIVVIIDKSGSMSPLKSKTIEGFNEFLFEQKKIKDKTNFSLILFSSPDKEDIIFDSVDINEVSELTNDIYHTVGTTALYDCLGKTIKSVNKKIKKSENKPNKVLFVIITDGEENSSRYYTKNEILKLIKKKEDKKDWSFLYLGANQDSFIEGGKIGISKNRIMDFDFNDTGVLNAYSKISNYTSSFRSSSIDDSKKIKI